MMSCVVVCEPLCFVFRRFGKIPEKQLKQVLIDFFDADVLSLAKSRLSDDIGKLNLEKWPRPTQHRNSDNRAKLEVDDIITLLSFLDEQLLFENVPIYVCEDIDRIPSTKWMDGDLQLIMAKLTSLQEDNSELRAQLKVLMGIMADLPKDIGVQNRQLVRQLAFESVAAAAAAVNSDSAILDNNAMMCDPQPARLNSDSDWPQLTTNHGISENHPPVGHSLVGSVTADSEGEGGTWRLQASRRLKRKKTNSGHDLSTDTVKQSTSTSDAVNSKKPSTVKVVGKLQSGSCKIQASDAVVTKSVYCVSNISCGYSVEDMIAFLADNDVKVVSCFESKTKFEGTKAFRVCINSKHKEHFLCPDIWPENVIIRDWFFKSKSIQTNDG